LIARRIEVHVLIIEDRKDLALMLKKALEEKEHSAVVAFDGLNGLMHAEAGDFDAIVLDLMLPGLSGQDITRKLRSSNNRVPILALTARDTVGDIVATLDLGVDDYLTKPFAVAEFMARLRAVARRSPTQQGVRLEVADIVLDTTSGEVTRGGRPVSLTRTEYLLLDYLMRRAGHVLSRSSLIERVWKTDAGIEANTLEAFIRNLRAKLDDHDEHQLIQTVRGVGYRLRAARSTQ
jgi:DNA-binding response OmpR family regulator